jgi:thiamine biosynthesis lipoprotein
VALAVAVHGVLALILAGCETPAEPDPLVELRGETMGTTYTVKLAALPAGATAATLKAQVDARLERVNRLMSTYRSDSDVSRFNRRDDTDWFPVARETATVAEIAGRIGQASSGALDPTVYPLVRLWGFGPDAATRKIPDDVEISLALERVGYAKIGVRLEPPALRKSDAGVTLDLSAIAKGFAVDQVAEYLGSLSVGDYFVEVGGEIRVRGGKPSGQPWVVGIEKPVTTGRQLHRAVELRDGALATSGDYRNFFELDGHRYSHTIDPRSGRPVEHRLAAVSIWAATCTEADGWATAMMVLGPEAGYHLAVKEGLAALFVVRSSDGFEERWTEAFRRLVEP